MTSRSSARRWGLCALTMLMVLAASPVKAQPAGEPACSEVQAVNALLEGAYADLTCPEGDVRVAVRPQQPAPALGPASVVRRVSRRGSVLGHTLRDSAGRRYGVVNE